MKSVLISIQPYWVFLIIAQTMGWNISEEKTVEVRKNYPKSENWDKVAKIYCSKDKKSFAQIPKEYQPLMERFLGKVIGEFVCDEIYTINKDSCGWFYGNCNEVMGIMYAEEVEELYHCIPDDELKNYLGHYIGYGWHISNLVIYDKPRELSEFSKYGFSHPVWLKRPPQSWCYVESEVTE